MAAPAGSGVMTGISSIELIGVRLLLLKSVLIVIAPALGTTDENR